AAQCPPQLKKRAVLPDVNWPPAAQFLCIALVPLILYKIFLRVWLHSSSIPTRHFRVIPFSGFVADWRPHHDISLQLVAVVIPGCICLAIAVWALVRVGWNVELALLLANTLLFVVFMGPAPYQEVTGSTRPGTGIIIAALCCLP